MTIVAEAKAYWPRLIKEGIEIKKLKPTERANMQASYEIDPIWDIHLGFGIAWFPGFDLHDDFSGLMGCLCTDYTIGLTSVIIENYTIGTGPYSASDGVSRETSTINSKISKKIQ